jgi:hypothetical protein
MAGNDELTEMRNGHVVDPNSHVQDPAPQRNQHTAQPQDDWSDRLIPAFPNELSAQILDHFGPRSAGTFGQVNMLWHESTRVTGMRRLGNREFWTNDSPTRPVREFNQRSVLGNVLVDYPPNEYDGRLGRPGKKKESGARPSGSSRAGQSANSKSRALLANRKSNERPMKPCRAWIPPKGAAVYSRRVDKFPTPDAGPFNPSRTSRGRLAS